MELSIVIINDRICQDSLEIPNPRVRAVTPPEWAERA